MNLDLENERANVIINGVKDVLRDDSQVQCLLESPGVGMALAKMISVEPVDIHLLSLNCFRIGAWLAFESAKIERLYDNT